MIMNLIRPCFLAVSIVLLATACSMAKLEARMDANPQCKDVVNPKTGALMPCPGSDKAFYREVGLAPAKPVPASSNLSVNAPVAVGVASQVQGSSSTSTKPAAGGSAKAITVQGDCKPQIHKKTGVTMPCPAPD